MTELTLTLIKLGFLAVLWLFVLSAVSVIRTDLFGTKQSKPAKQPKQKVSKSKPQRGTPRLLYIVDGPNAGQSVPLTDEPIILGRGTDAAIRLDDDYVSTRHVRFVNSGGQWFVEDMGSTNGTYMGKNRLTSPVAIGIGIPVRLGKTIVELRK